MTDEATLVATTSGSANIDGQDYAFVEGVTRVRASHALVKHDPEFFKAVEDNRHYEVEDATAAPGEKRGGSTATKQTTTTKQTIPKKK